MKVKWQPIKTHHPKFDYEDVWVYQPAVEYAGGQKYDPYVVVATRQMDGRYYSEAYNVILEPTHWAPFELPKPPNDDVVKSPAVAPHYGGIFGWSSGGGDIDVVGETEVG